MELHKAGLGYAGRVSTSFEGILDDDVRRAVVCPLVPMPVGDGKSENRRTDVFLPRLRAKARMIGITAHFSHVRPPRNKWHAVFAATIPSSRITGICSMFLKLQFESADLSSARMCTVKARTAFAHTCAYMYTQE